MSNTDTDTDTEPPDADTETSTEQTQLDLHRTMNRYPERGEKWRSSEVYEPPRRTVSNRWMKFHADRDCGSQNVYYVENTSTSTFSDEKGQYHLRCGGCGYRIPESEVLFIGGPWYDEYGWVAYGKLIEDLRLPSERVLNLGPDPSHDELVQALNLTRIERDASFHGVSFYNERYDSCESCGKETMVRFDNDCRMCYTGQWTDRMTDTVAALARSVRIRNHSFAHRIDQKVDPLHPTDKATPDQILWRKRAGRASKIVVVTQRLKDDKQGHYEYILSDPQTNAEWRYHEDEVAAEFYDTDLTIGDWHNSIEDTELELEQLCEQAAKYDE